MIKISYDFIYHDKRMYKYRKFLGYSMNQKIYSFATNARIGKMKSRKVEKRTEDRRPKTEEDRWLKLVFLGSLNTNVNLQVDLLLVTHGSLTHNSLTHISRLTSFNFLPVSVCAGK